MVELTILAFDASCRLLPARQQRNTKGADMADPFTEEDGHQLAVDLVREVEAHITHRRDHLRDVSDAEFERTYDSGEVWRNDESVVLRRYLATVRESGSAALEKGFLAVLTSHLGSGGVEGGPFGLESYEPKGEHSE